MSTPQPTRSKSRLSEAQSIGSPWRSPVAGPAAVHAGKESLRKYRELKKNATPQKSISSPLPPRLNALLSSRIDRRGRSNHASLEPSSPMPAWRSPEGTKSGQKILQSYRAQKERAGLLRSPLQRIDHSSPLPPRLAAVLSTRFSRYRHVQPEFSDVHEEQNGQSPLVPRKLVPPAEDDDDTENTEPQTAEPLPDFEQAYLASVLYESGNASSSAGNASPQKLWEALRRAHSSGSALSAVVATRADRLRDVLRSGGDPSTLLSDLRAAAMQRQLLDQQLGQLLDELGGPADLSSSSSPDNVNVNVSENRKAWLSASEIAKVRQEVTTSAMVEVNAVQAENKVLATKLELYQKQVSMMMPTDSIPSIPKTGNGNNTGGNSSTVSDQEVSVMQAKLKKSNQQLEESQALASMLRTALAQALDERESLATECKHAQEELELSRNEEDDNDAELQAQRQLLMRDESCPVTPTSSSSLAVDHDARKDGDEDRELLELESASRLSADLLSSANDHDIPTTPERLPMSPNTMPRQMSPKAPCSPALVSYPEAWVQEYAQLVEMHEAAAQSEHVHNVVVRSLDAGVAFEQFLQLTGFADTPHLRTHWDETMANEFRQLKRTFSDTNDPCVVDPRKISEVVDKAFFSAPNDDNVPKIQKHAAPQVPETSSSALAWQGLNPARWLYSPSRPDRRSAVMII